MTGSCPARAAGYADRLPCGCIVLTSPTGHRSSVSIAATDPPCPRACPNWRSLTTARIWDAAFEWEIHRPHALAAGVPEDVVNALAEDRTPEFKVEDEELVYLFTRELNLKRSVSDLLFERTVSCLGRDGTVDLVGVLGYYGLISMTIKAFDIPPPS